MKELNLILPVFNGGERFKRALKSVEGCVKFFHTITISINGKDNALDTISVLKSSLINNSKLILLKTGEDMTPVEHAIWIRQNLKSKLKLSDNIMFLAHDDELIHSSFALWYNTLYVEYSDTSWIGNYQVVKENPADMKGSTPVIKKVLLEELDSLKLSVSSWLEYLDSTPDKYVFTNMSGMVFPVKTYFDFIKFERYTNGNKGARMEYMLLTHYMIKNISSVHKPLIRIYEHSMQEGKNLSNISLHSDEIRYHLWMFINFIRMRKAKYIFQFVNFGVIVRSVFKILLYFLLFNFRKSKNTG